MPDYSFRIRFVMPPSESLGIDEHDIDLSEFYSHSLRLASGNPGKSIGQASHLVLTASGFSTESEARDAGERCRDFFAVVLAQMKVAVDFGDRAPRSGFTRQGLQLLEQQLGQRALNDYHGLMTFATDPPPQFGRLGDARVIRATDKAQFLESVSGGPRQPVELTNRERLAYDLFSASYFQRSQDARLILLVIALESLVSLGPRSEPALIHVEQLIRVTKDSTALSQSERHSILGSLEWLKTESIGASVRRLLTQRLPTRKYMEMSPGRFFTHCYELRSRLVHGREPFPSRNEVGTVAANLANMVGDALSQPYLERAEK